MTGVAVPAACWAALGNEVRYLDGTCFLWRVRVVGKAPAALGGVLRCGRLTAEEVLSAPSSFSFRRWPRCPTRR